MLKIALRLLACSVVILALASATSTLVSVPVPIPASAQTSDSTTTEELELVATFHCVSVYANFTGDTNENNSAVLEYKKSADGTWITGMDLVVDRRATVSSTGNRVDNPFAFQWRGSIIGLDEDTAYDVRVTFTDADGVAGANPVAGTISTRSSTISLGGGTTYYVATSGNNGGAGTIGDPWQTLAYATSRLSAGDTLYVRAGTYYEYSLTLPSGTSWDNLTSIVNYGAESVTIDAQHAGNPFSLTGRNYWQIKGLRIMGTDNSCILANACHHFVIDGCTFEDACNPSGGGMNAVVRIVGSDSNDGVIRNNHWTGDYVDGRPGYEGNDCLSIAESNGGWIVYNNTIDSDDYWDGLCGAGGSRWNGGFARDSDIYDNTIYNPSDDGIELEGGGVNNRCWGNTIKDNGSPGYGLAYSCAAIVLGPTYLYYNTAISPNQGAVKTGGFGYPDPVLSNGHLFVYNNTFYGGDPQDMDYTVAPYANTNVTWNQHYFNNIMVGGYYACWSVRGISDDNEYDYNSLTDWGPGTRMVIWQDVQYQTIAEVCAGAGQECHGISSDPLFNNAAGDDFTLQDSSPCIDAGRVITGFNDASGPYPYQGSAPDIGAFEFSSEPVCNADFTASPREGIAGVTEFVLTDATWGGTPPYTYEWDFNNDGTVDSTAQNPTHVYASAGTYSVSLAVTDSLSTTSTEVKVAYIDVYVRGDANGDGNTNALDMTQVELIIMGLAESTPGADANADGNVNALDLTQIELIIMAG